LDVVWIVIDDYWTMLT